MASSHAPTSDKLFNSLVELKRHMRTCRLCMHAKKARDAQELCSYGILKVLDIMTRVDDLISLRRSAFTSDGYHIFPCPDLSKHGAEYEMTAEPVTVTGIQGRLL